MRCSRHRVTNCGHSICRTERDRRSGSQDTTSSQSDPTSLLYETAFGSSSPDFSTSSSDCDSSSGSGSSPDSSDSGSSSSSDCSY